MTNATATRYEAQVDEKLAKLWERHYDVVRDLKIAEVDVLNFANVSSRAVNRSGKRVYDFTVDAALMFAPRAPYAEAFCRSRDLLLARRAELEELKAETDAQEALYTGWSRFFLVTNAGGHIHSSRRCSTCYPTTLFGWLPQLSGLDEAAAVADQGPRLCTVCFPSAPVEWTQGLAAAAGCGGSGAEPREYRAGARYGACRACGKIVALAPSSGLIRKHNADAK